MKKAILLAVAVACIWASPVRAVHPDDHRGDINADGFIDGEDINPFVWLCFGQPYPWDANRCDMNLDTFFDGEDINPFVLALTNPAAFYSQFPWPGEDMEMALRDIILPDPFGVPTPEPATLSLLGLGTVALLRRRR